MRRTLSALTLAVALTGCGAMGSSLPYHAGSLDDSSMTIEQYAVGRLPAGSHLPSRCAKPSEHGSRAVRERAAKRCGAR